jgi:hypothetical protein
MKELSCKEPRTSLSWGFIDWIKWKWVPVKLGGGIPYIQRFKTAWVAHNSIRIGMSARKYKLPPQLLAGVSWIEVGGDPEMADNLVFGSRFAFGWTGLPILKKPPLLTSFGSVSMQLRTAAQTMGINTNNWTFNQWKQLSFCLEKDAFNIEIVARHLRELANYDKLPSSLSLEDVRIVGTRYNRGMGVSLENIKKNTSYGDFIVRNWSFFGNIFHFGHPNGITPIGAHSINKDK